MFKPTPEMLKEEKDFEQEIERELLEFKKTKQYLNKKKAGKFFKNRKEKIDTFYNNQREKAIKIFAKPLIDVSSQLIKTREQLQEYANTIKPKINNPNEEDAGMKIKKEGGDQFFNYIDSITKQGEFRDKIIEDMIKDFEEQIEKERLEHEIKLNKLLDANPIEAAQENARFSNDKEKKVNDFNAKIITLKKQFFDNFMSQIKNQGEINKKKIEKLCEREKPSIQLQNLMDRVQELSKSWDKISPNDKKFNPH
jgi:hypothetical protein